MLEGRGERKHSEDTGTFEVFAPKLGELFGP